MAIPSKFHAAVLKKNGMRIGWSKSILLPRQMSVDPTPL